MPASIPCLLLQSIGSQEGPTGGKFMTKITFVQRLNTNGGFAPAEGCLVAGDVGKQTLVPYTADYYFFRAARLDPLDGLGLIAGIAIGSDSLSEPISSATDFASERLQQRACGCRG